MTIRWAWLPGLVTALSLTGCRFEEETPIQWVHGDRGCVEVGQRGRNLRLARYAPGSAESFFVRGCGDRVAYVASSDPAVATFELESYWDGLDVILTPVGVGAVDVIFQDGAGQELDRFGFTIYAPSSIRLYPAWVGDRPLALLGAPIGLPHASVLDEQGEEFWNFPTVTWEATADATVEADSWPRTVTVLGPNAAVTCTSGDASALLLIDAAAPEDLTDLQLEVAQTVLLEQGAGGGFYGEVEVTPRLGDRIVHGASSCQWSFSAEPTVIRTWVYDYLYGDGTVIMWFFFAEVETVDATCTLGAVQGTVRLNP